MQLRLFTTYSWQELRHHPWRNLAAVVSVMLGVALALAVHLINASALDEFAQAVRSVGGQPDYTLRSRSGAAQGVTLEVWGQLQHDPDVALASPVLELNTFALQDGKKLALRVLGVDSLQVAALAPELMPLPDANAPRLAMLSPDTVFLNPLAHQALRGDRLQLQQGLQLRNVQVAGSVRASGSALAVMDIAAAQDLFGLTDHISRVDLLLRPGTDKAAWAQRVQAAPGWPADLLLREPGDAEARMGNLSRAYRVNLTVLALVALFTGGFLVFSVLALSVTKRAQQLALLGVLGLTGRQRLRLVLAEAAALGTLGSGLGIALGTGLAALALRLLGADLGGGYFSGGTPQLQWSSSAAGVFGLLGVAAAMLGAWAPARQAQRIAPAQALKGLGSATAGTHAARWGVVLLLLGGALALLPPVAGIPLAAYGSVALLLLGGVATLPALVGGVLDRVAPWVARKPLALLAVERARRVRESAAVAVSGVVAALSLAVALTVMVASFRHSVTQWLDVVLPADLYVRTAGSASASDTAYFDPRFIAAAAKLPGVARISTQRSLPLTLDPAQPPVTLLVRPLHDAVTGELALPLVGAALPVPQGRMGVYVSEAMLDLYGVRLGQDFPLLYASIRHLAPMDIAQAAPLFVAGVWRDYARQFGSVALDTADFARFSPDRRINDVSLWLDPGAQPGPVEAQLRALANQLANTPGGEAAQLLDVGSASQIRATSLRIFDRSFSVTYWLQAVAIGIGLFGVAASFSAQVLARRKEFGLLVHLGLTRRQILQVVALEGAAWSALGSLAGVGLGLAVAVVLVKVVNPQSFHWTMELNLPWMRLMALGAAVVLAGTVTAWLAGRAAAGRDAVMAVKEDW
ncbi:MAG: ABC transporter permease [Rhodoferax sp.]|nr:ABC transporter permease [Rhodoferax sp.]